jgi:hypothetical protein
VVEEKLEEEAEEEGNRWGKNKTRTVLVEDKPQK